MGRKGTSETIRQIVVRLAKGTAGGTAGFSASVEAQGAIDQLLKEKGGEIPAHGMPRLRSDNGSCYLSREFRGVLNEHGLHHARIKPHCPEENGVVERSNRTLREALEGEELTDLMQAQ